MPLDLSENVVKVLFLKDVGVRVKEAPFVCCNADKRIEMSCEKLVKCDKCNSLWHSGCLNFFLGGKDCCGEVR